jgi:serine/threonine protein kinase
MTGADSCSRCGTSLAMAMGDPGQERCFSCGARIALQTLAITGARPLSAFDTEAAARIQELARRPEFASRYKLGRMLGRGAAALVFEATHIQMGRSVAIKFLCQYDEEEEMERFRAEARTLAAIRHPHVLQLFDFDHLKKHPYLVVEFLEGGTLRARLDEEGMIAPLTAISIFAGCLAGLDACHSKGIIHRDLKPENVLFDGDRRPKLTDFGIAKLMGQASMTRTGEVIGTPLYMSPEQVRGDTAGAPADLYAAGLILYEMLTGRHPFRAETAIQVFSMHLEEPPPPMGIEGLPPQLRSLVERLLAKNPADRPARARDITEDLRASVRYLQQVETGRTRVARDQRDGEFPPIPPANRNVGVRRATRVLAALHTATMQQPVARRTGLTATVMDPPARSTSGAGLQRPRTRSGNTTPIRSALIPRPSQPPAPRTRLGSPMVFRALLLVLLLLVVGPLVALQFMEPPEDPLTLAHLLPSAPADHTVRIEPPPRKAFSFRPTSHLSTRLPTIVKQVDELWEHWARRSVQRERMRRVALELLEQGVHGTAVLALNTRRPWSDTVTVQEAIAALPGCLEEERKDGRTLGTIVRQCQGETPQTPAEIATFGSIEGLSFCVWSSTELVWRVSRIAAMSSTPSNDLEATLKIRSTWEGPYPSGGLGMLQSYLVDLVWILQSSTAAPQEPGRSGLALCRLPHVARAFQRTTWRDADHDRVGASLRTFHGALRRLPGKAGPSLGELTRMIWDHYSAESTGESFQVNRAESLLRSLAETIPAIRPDLAVLERILLHREGMPD